MNCIQCDANLAAGAKFCSECGASQRMACPACDATITPTARFCQACGVTLTAPAQLATPAAAGRESPPSAATVPHAVQRRHMSVMFCDLVGSVDISRKLDPEDLRDLVRSYREACAVVIAHYGGTAAQFQGDGIVVYFGYPIAHEDGTRRAVQAGLEIVKAIVQLAPSALSSYQVDLAVRVSVDTGLVLVGDSDAAYGGGRLALGDTPNLAARLQQIAAPNSVVVSQATHRLVLGFFQMTSLGAHTLKGWAEPMEVFSVEASSGSRNRLEAAPKHLLVPYVGRAHVVASLAKAWLAARESPGHAILLTGDPGMGKSRLLSEFRKMITTDECEIIECYCSPYYSQTPLYPLVAPMRERLAIDAVADPAAALSVLREDLIAKGCEIETALPLLAKLFGLPPEAGYEPLAMHPLTQKQKTQVALVALLTSRVASKPLLLVMEDMHWVDDTTMELLGSILQELSKSRVLLILTTRKGFAPPWLLHESLSHVPVTLLSEGETKTLIQKVVGEKPLPQKVLSLLLQKTDGNPLYIEEMTRMFMASGLLRETANGYEENGTLPDSLVPESLQDMLMARLDRLPQQAKTVLQLGATIGREWPFELLLAAFPDQEEAFSTGVEQLIVEGILFPTDGGFSIKHALIQDASYESLLKRTRQSYHERIALALERGVGGASFPERIAQHWTKAGQPARAVPLWLAAGQQAVAASATVEAESHLRHGLEAVAELPQSVERDQTELALLATLGVALIFRLGWAAPEVAEVYLRAQVITERVGSSPHLFWVLWGMWAFYLVKGDQNAALPFAQRMTQVADTNCDEGQQLEAHFAMGLTAHFMGQLELAQHHLGAAVARYSPEKHRHQAYLTGQDVGATSRCQLGLVLYQRGETCHGIAQSLDAVRLGAELKHPFSHAYALGNAAWLDAQRQYPDGPQANASQTIELGVSQAMGFWVVWGSIFTGRELAYSGQAGAGAKQLEEAITAYRGIGCGMNVPYFLTLLAEVESQNSNPAKALSHLAQARQLIVEGGEAAMSAEIERLEAQIRRDTATPGDQIEAKAIEQLYRSALEIAQRQGNRLFALRAATGLAQCLAQTSAAASAAELLAQAISAMPDQSASVDLDRASSVLRSLAADPTHAN